MKSFENLVFITALIYIGCTLIVKDFFSKIMISYEFCKDSVKHTSRNSFILVFEAGSCMKFLLKNV